MCYTMFSSSHDYNFPVNEIRRGAAEREGEKFLEIRALIMCELHLLAICNFRLRTEHMARLLHEVMFVYWIAL